MSWPHRPKLMAESQTAHKQNHELEPKKGRSGYNIYNFYIGGTRHVKPSLNFLKFDKNTGIQIWFVVIWYFSALDFHTDSKAPWRMPAGEHVLDNI